MTALPDQWPPTIVRVYRGSWPSAYRDFQHDSATMAASGYFPMNQQFIPGSWGCGAYAIGILLILLFGLGLLILGYLVIVKPAGTLTVMYSRG